MEMGFWKGVGYLLLLPVMLLSFLFAITVWWSPIRLSRYFREKWGDRGIIWFLLITLVATAIWWGVFVRPGGP